MTRVKRINAAGKHITRLAEPVVHADRNIVEVTYSLTVVDGQTSHADETREVHAMRYLFLPEFELLADNAGLELVETGQWLSGNPAEHGLLARIRDCPRKALNNQCMDAVARLVGIEVA